MNNVVSNPNDFKVVSFHNSTDFHFTPEMGCMYDGRIISGKSGISGIAAGETMMLPYHIAHQLALNLAKVAIVSTSPNVDPSGVPTGVPLWDTSRLESLKNSYLVDEYSEEKPAAMSETDKLMAKVEEYKLMVDKFVSDKDKKDNNVKVVTNEVKTYQDKAEVIEELTKRKIKFDARKNKADLEKLLA